MKRIIICLMLIVFVLAGCNQEVVDNTSGVDEPPIIKRAELTEREEMLLNSITNLRELYLIEVVNFSNYSWVNIYLDILTSEGLENYTNTGSMIDKDDNSFMISVNLGELGENDQASWGVAKLTETGYSKYSMEMEDPYRNSTLSSVVNEKEYLAGQKNIFLTVRATYDNELMGNTVDQISDISELSAKEEEIIYVFSFELLKER